MQIIRDALQPPPGAAEGQPVAQPTPAPRGRLVTKPEYDKLSAYFNLDNGTGRIRGVYMQGNEGVRNLRAAQKGFSDGRSVSMSQ